MQEPGDKRGAARQPHGGEDALFGEAQIIDGGRGGGGPENILSYAKAIGKHRQPGCCGVLHLRERERELAECSLTANEGENVSPVCASPSRTH